MTAKRGGTKITINYVAEKAGVSKTTVSRFLNGRFEMISADTRERIASVVEELDYRPNRIAQSLKSRSSRTIGCLVSDIGSPFSSILVKGISSILNEQGYRLILADSEDNPVNERNAIDSFLESQVDGLIVNSTGANDRFLLQLRDNGLPVVFADRCLSIPGEIDTVETNNTEMTCSCMQYLSRMGYTKVGFFANGIGKNTTRMARLSGYLKTMEEVFGYDGRDTVYEYVSHGDGSGCADRILEFITTYSQERVALFAVNGVAMLDILNALQKMKLQAGADVGVCGFDNWGWADLIPPGITTIAQDSFAVGAEAAKIILDRLSGEGDPACRKIVLPSKLEVRGSTVR